MKKNLVLLVLTIIVVVNLFSQPTSIKSVPSVYSSSHASALMFVKRDTIVIECDTIYLINPGRYRLYKALHEATLSDKDSLCSKILKAYQSSLLENETAYDKLLDNNKKLEKTTSDLIIYSQNSLQNVQKTLEFTQITLDQSFKSLELANNYIKKEKWNSVGKKILVGVGGACFGLLLGMLIMK
jgi:ElaB/YqjD/DUF883 family membrane-anchored ribosome-binding protein